MSGSEDEISYRSLLETLAPLARVADFLAAFGRNPVKFVTTIISLYLINGVLNIGSYLVGSIVSVFDVIRLSLAGVQTVLVASAGGVGAEVLEALAGVLQQLSDVVAVAGPAAPIVAVGGGAVVLYVSVWASYKITVAILGEIPVGSSIVDLLGLR